jgi:UrcA family protein
MNTYRNMTLAALALVAQAFGSTAANASDPDRTALIRNVNLRDVDLDSAVGARTAYSRIASAAKIVCAPYDGRQLVEKARLDSCIAHAVEQAVRDVNEPMLTRYYLTRNPKSELNPALSAKR